MCTPIGLSSIGLSIKKIKVLRVLRYTMLCNFSRIAHIKTPCQFRENVSRNGFTNRDGLNKQTDKQTNNQTKLKFKSAVSESSDILLKLTIFNFFSTDCLD